MSRRALLGVTTAGIATAGLGGGLYARSVSDDAQAAQPGPPAVFDGVHQPGIATRQQRHACVAGFDVLEPYRSNLVELMRRWTPLSLALMRGEPGPARPRRDVVDSGVADDLGPENLTITVGFGPRVFGDAFGLSASAPKGILELPAFHGDQLNPQWTGGDVLLQICADDPTVVAHALREARARVPGIATTRWTHFGFLTTSGSGRTPRDLFGQLDGTSNKRPGSPDFDEIVWAGADEPEWLHGGTYLVFRKIRMLTPMWDLATAEEQNAALGRDRRSGAPLSGGTEHTPLDLTKTDSSGRVVIPMDAHVRIAHQAPPIFRRAYNYDNGLVIPAGSGIPDEGHTYPPGTAPHDHGTGPPSGGHWDNGLLFMSCVRDPATQYVPLQEALSRNDKLHTFLRHTGSAVFAVPGAPRDTDHIGQALLS